ncbi:MAG: sulfotransferase family 2 domain-containing protein [Novosphingobium sp.]|uniref:sulfotransferase family 2 domain-containing protein n=1 Tax=Novosphingobium sp. TaxID=1874826 RepID=UPI003C7EA3FF
MQINNNEKTNRVLNSVSDILRVKARNSAPDSIVNLVRKIRRRKVLKAYADAGVAFLHVPRTAGTSIASALYGMQINHFPLREMTPLMRDLRILPHFAIVRNPWDRAVSAWNFVRRGGGQDNLVQVRSHHRYQVPAFRTFEHFVQDWLPGCDMDLVDGMFRPQMYFLADADGQLSLDHLGRFEDLSATVRWLQGHVPELQKIPHMNAVDRAPYKLHYTPSSRDLIGHIYAQDIEKFGYDF